LDANYLEGKIEEERRRRRKKKKEEELSGPCNSASHLFHVQVGGYIIYIWLLLIEGLSSRGAR